MLRMSCSVGLQLQPLSSEDNEIFRLLNKTLK